MPADRTLVTGSLVPLPPPPPPIPFTGDPTIVYWRVGVCDLDGHLLSLLSPVATGKQLKFPLCRPASMTFQVPSFDPHVNILHTDGFPFLSCGNRVIKAWRRTAEDDTWTIRFAGIVWNLQDTGDANATYTAVTAYDPFQLLTKRVIRAAGGTFHETVSLALQPGNVIAKALVDRTISFAGACGIDTSSGTFTTAPDQSGSWDQQYVATGIIDLCDTGKLDVWFDPVDQTDGILAWMNAGPARGSIDPDDPHPLLSFAAPGHSALSMDRAVSMDDFANSIYMYPQDVNHTVVTAEDIDSEDVYHTYEDVSVISDISDSDLVQDLANQELAMRKAPKELLTLLPTPGRAFLPWRHYFLGDLVNVAVSYGIGETFPTTREKLLGLQRIFGITIDIEDATGIERVSGIDFSVGQSGIAA